MLQIPEGDTWTEWHRWCGLALVALATDLSESYQYKVPAAGIGYPAQIANPTRTRYYDELQQVVRTALDITVPADLVQLLPILQIHITKYLELPMSSYARLMYTNRLRELYALLQPGVPAHAQPEPLYHRLHLRGVLAHPMQVMHLDSLTIRARNALGRSEIRTVNALVTQSPEALARYDQIGPRMICEIEAVLVAWWPQHAVLETTPLLSVSAADVDQLQHLLPGWAPPLLPQLLWRLQQIPVEQQTSTLDLLTRYTSLSDRLGDSSARATPTPDMPAPALEELPI